MTVGPPGEAALGGAVPRVWNVPTRNADFTGRDAILERLQGRANRRWRAVVVAQALYGLGGVGKTQMALEYAHRFKADYDLVWWIPRSGRRRSAWPSRIWPSGSVFRPATTPRSCRGSR